MMTTHGRISQFHPGKEDWSTWVAQLKYYFTANKVTEDDQKRAILLSNVPPSVFKLVRNIFGDDIETTSFDRIAKSVKAHYEPKPSEIVQIQDSSSILVPVTAEKQLLSMSPS